MLGVTSYQEALRALGGWAARDLRLAEHPEQASITLTIDGQSRQVSASRLQAVVEASRARRGEATTFSPISDVLRSVGLALDELDASSIELVLCANSLDVAFKTTGGEVHELSYADEELEAVRHVAAARRTGHPLRRVLILHGATDTAVPVRELLLFEFAVQALPTEYARAVAEAETPPDAVLATTAADPQPTLDALRTLRMSPRTAHVPIVVLAAPDAHLDPADAFTAGADDLLPVPFQPAQLRARLRTWLLRRGVA